MMMLGMTELALLVGLIVGGAIVAIAIAIAIMRRK
jgi:hypothetical protein